MLNPVDFNEICSDFTGSFINAPKSYHTTHGHSEDWLTLADHLKTPARVAERFHIRRNIGAADIKTIGNFSFQWLARVLTFDLRESRERIPHTFRPAFSEEEIFFFAINPSGVEDDPFAIISGFVFLTAKYQNALVTSMRWSHDAYIAMPRGRATLQLVSSDELKEILSSHPTWQERITNCFAAELKTIEYHHTYSLKQVKSALEKLENAKTVAV